MMFITVFNVVACVALMYHSVCVINRMSKLTNHFVRFAYILLGVGSLGALITPIESVDANRVVVTMLNSGVALILVIVDRRRKSRGY